MKTLGEIRDIVRDRRLDSLDVLSGTELRILLAILNREKVPLLEENCFSQFYLEVVNRIRNHSI